MALKYLLGVDAGLTTTKAVLFDPAGRAIAAGRAETEVTSPHLRWQERDMTVVWRQAATAIATCLREAGVSGDVVAAVGLCGHNDGVYPVDEAGAPVRAAILATDSRAHTYVDRYRADGTANTALTLTGQSPFAPSPAALYAWLRDHEPDTLQRARWLLFAKDWLRLRLTGQVATDPTEASASFTDVHTQRYAEAALALYGLASVAEQLPPILGPATVAGRVTEAVAADTGLAAGTPVVTGAHDVDASALGVGAIEPGAVSVVMGTFAINQVVSTDVRLDHRWQARTFLTPGRWLHMSTSPSSASNLDWVVRLIGPYDETGRPDTATAVASGLAVDTTDVPLFLPYLYGSPHGTAEGAAIGASFAQLRGWHGRDHLLRAALEGVVFNHRTHLETLGTQFRLAGPIRLCGGGARTPGWSQLLADAVGLPVEVTDTDEAGARGAALLAGIGVGWYTSLAQAAAAAVRVARRHEPRPDAMLEERYRRYLALVAAARATGSGAATAGSAGGG